LFFKGKEVLIGIVYVTDLDVTDDGKYRLVLPALPYAPNANKRQFQRPSRPAGASDSFESQVAYGLRIQVSFEMSSNIKSVASPSHPISFEFGDKQTAAMVTYAPQGKRERAEEEEWNDSNDSLLVVVVVFLAFICRWCSIV
jgi:hypothetical protein